jgi:hypothetical protein
VRSSSVARTARRPGVACGRAISLVVLLALSTCGLLRSGAGAEAAGVPRLFVSAPSASVGQLEQVSASGLHPGDLYQVQVCGSNASQGSVDCASSLTGTALVDPSGAFQVWLRVALPPTRCPCVVSAVSVTSPVTVMAPITIAGAPSGAPAVVPPAALPSADVLNAEFTGRTPLAQWFGFSAPRTLRLTLHNAGSVPTSALHVYVREGSTPLASERLAGLPANGIEAYDIPVALPAMSIGTVTVDGRVLSVADQNAGFSTSVSVWPIGLILAGVILLQMVLLALRNVVRRRYDRHNPPRERGATDGPGRPAEVDTGEVPAIRPDTAEVPAVRAGVPQ